MSSTYCAYITCTHLPSTACPLPPALYLLLSSLFSYVLQSPFLPLMIRRRKTRKRRLLELSSGKLCSVSLLPLTKRCYIANHPHFTFHFIPSRVTQHTAIPKHSSPTPLTQHLPHYPHFTPPAPHLTSPHPTLPHLAPPSSLPYRKKKDARMRSVDDEKVTTGELAVSQHTGKVELRSKSTTKTSAHQRFSLSVLDDAVPANV